LTGLTGFTGLLSFYPGIVHFPIKISTPLTAGFEMTRRRQELLQKMILFKPKKESIL